MTIDPTLLDDLEWRGLIAHSTDLAALREALTSGSVRFYVGFDPTAPSLHMGNLLQLTTARRLQDAGHTPYLLVGGATGMIGDPKDSGERTLNSLDTVKDWSERVRRQVEPFVAFEGPNAATVVNNYDWTASLSTIDFLRDVGKHFPVNRMLGRETVKRRLESGISYTEFSYVLLQSMDFLNLYRDHGVTLQHGGEDQWGNITGGVELIRRADGGRAHAFVTPLVTKPDGTKYGKTEGDALWLDPRHDVAVHLPPVVAQRRRLPGQPAAPPVHVPPASRDRGDRGGESRQALAAHRAEAAGRRDHHARARWRGDRAGPGRGRRALRRRRPPRLEPDHAGLGAARGRAASVPALVPVVDLLVETGLAKSRGEARRTITEGGAYLNNVRVEDPEAEPAPTDLIGGSWLVLRRGKKRFAGVEVG